MLNLLLYTLLLQPALQEAEWVDLFNGKDYSGFIFWIIGGPERSFAVKDGCMVMHPVPTGQDYTTDRLLKVDDQTILSRVPLLGFTYTRKQYRNFELRYDWKYERPVDLKDDNQFAGNTGAFLYLTRVLKSWPQSVEVDGRYLEAGKLISHGKALVTATDDAKARKLAQKPVGQWNTTHVRCVDGVIQVTINGQLVAQGTTDQREGAIGFQAQGACVYYRQIKVRELK